jgi:hypothetical protein
MWQIAVDNLAKNDTAGRLACADKNAEFCPFPNPMKNTASPVDRTNSLSVTSGRGFQAKRRTSMDAANEGRSRWAGARFVLGGVLAVLLLLGLAEAFLRLSPPSDLHPFLGEASPLRGVYLADADFGVRYQSWDAFCSDNAERMRGYLPFRTGASSRPWAFFGNSFVQARGMLADTVRHDLPDRPVFNLGRNEPICVRFAQIRLLLENGLAPERIFVTLMPMDVAGLGEQPLATLHVTRHGAMTFEPRLPGGAAGAVVRHSRVAFTGWCRSGFQRGNPSFSGNYLQEKIDPLLLADLEHLFASLARVSRQHEVPLTVILIPTLQQVCRGASCGFQDTLVPMLRRQGLDVCDPRDAFRGQPEVASLFLPDKHFSPAGNRILLTALLDHLRSLEPSTDAVPSPPIPARPAAPARNEGRKS